MTEAAALARMNGGVASLRQLDAAGVSRAEVERARRSTELRRVRNGWFAVAEAPTDVVRAVRVGGTLTGTSVARLHGLWLLDDRMLHVRVPRTASRLRAPGDSTIRLRPEEHRVCVHYSAADAADAAATPDAAPWQHPLGHAGPTTAGVDRRGTGLQTARDPLERALAEMFRCGALDAALVATESALHLRELSAAGVTRLGVALTPAHRRQLLLLDGSGESGLETLMRLFCLSRQMRVRAQVRIRGVGRVDLLIGDRLVIELDGEGFHTGPEFEEDRRRDFELVHQGYLVVRISYRMLMADRERIQAGVLALVRRDEHRWLASRARGSHYRARP